VGLYLDLEETKDVIEKLTERELSWSVPFADDLILWLHQTTSGHVGALSAMVESVTTNMVVTSFIYGDDSIPQALNTDINDRT